MVAGVEPANKGIELWSGEWINSCSYPFKCGRICHLAVLHHARLKFFRYDINAWKHGEPADWSIWRRMKEAGVRTGFVDRIVGSQHLEGVQGGIPIERV